MEAECDGANTVVFLWSQIDTLEYVYWVVGVFAGKVSPVNRLVRSNKV